MDSSKILPVGSNCILKLRNITIQVSLDNTRLASRIAFLDRIHFVSLLSGHF